MKPINQLSQSKNIFFKVINKIKVSFFRSNLCLFLLILATLPSFAQDNMQLMGADLNYQCIEGDTYQFTLNLYYYCDGNLVPANSAQITAKSDCQSTDTTFHLIRQDFGIEITPICSEYLQDQTTCSDPSNPYPGIKKFAYSKLFTLPCKATDWTFSFYELTRNKSTISNLDLSSQNSFGISALLNNAHPSHCSTRFQFSEVPISFFCQNMASQFKQHISFDETSGNYLSFASINPLDKNLSPIPYKNDFQTARPLNAHTYSFDDKTGEVAFRPAAPQNAVMTIVAEEFAPDGTLLGAIMRDIQIIVIEGCNQENINVNEPTIHFQDVCADETLSFEIVAQAVSDNKLFIQNNIEKGFPADNPPTLEITNENPLRAIFTWKPTLADTGNYNLVVSLSDDVCPIPTTTVETYNIWVSQPDQIQISNPNPIFCENNNEALRLHARGCPPFTWKYDGNSAAINFTASPDGSFIDIDIQERGKYDFTAENQEGQTAKSSIEFLEGFEVETNYTSIVCKGESTSISLKPSVGNADEYKYDWSEGTDLSCDTCSETVATPAFDQSYTVTITNKQSGCESIQTIDIVVEEASVNITESNPKPFVGEEITLEAEGIFENIQWVIEGDTIMDASSMINYTANDTKTINITATVTTEAGCPASANTQIEPKESEFVLPEAFSPNGDGVNDRFTILNPQQWQCSNEFDFELCIYDRWGNKIFQTFDMTSNWSGEVPINSVNNAQQSLGAYFYTIMYQCGDKEAYKQKGVVALMR